MPQNTASNLFDKLLMAPHKIMNLAGDDPHRNWLDNTLHQPSVKVSGILVASFMAAASLQGHPDKMWKALWTGVAGMGLHQALSSHRRSQARGIAIYYDTDPDGTLKTDAALKHALSLERNQAAAFFPVQAFFGSMLIGASVDQTAAYNLVAASYAAGWMTSSLANYWRPSQVLQDAWVAHAVPPPPKIKQPKPVFSEKLSPT